MGTETLDFVLDENVQIHGGNGFVSDYMAERYFRDARVNRIFEGTNEINRMLIPGMLVRRGLKGEVPLVAAARALQDEVLSASPQAGGDDDAPLGAERRLVASFKKVALMVIGTALQTFGDRLETEQEVLSFAADVLIDTYAAESAVARASQAMAAGHHARAVARGRRARIRRRGRDPGRGRREERARGHGGGRHAANAARRAPPRVEAGAVEHGQAEASARRGRHGAGQVQLRVTRATAGILGS